VNSVDTASETESLMSKRVCRAVHCSWDLVDLELGCCNAFDIPVRRVGQVLGAEEVRHILVVSEDTEFMFNCSVSKAASVSAVLRCFLH